MNRRCRANAAAFPNVVARVTGGPQHPNFALRSSHASVTSHPVRSCSPASRFSRPAAFAQKTQLLVYTALETDQIKAYQEGFNKAYPDIEIKWVRDSTGVITAKLLAEKANPQADVVMGVAASSLALLDKQGMLQPYAPLGLDAIIDASTATRRIRRPGWAWTCGAPPICFNTVEAQKQQHPQARELEGPDQARLQGPDRDAEPGLQRHRLLRRDGLAPVRRRGKGGGWKYMDGLHENIAQYTHSGSKPCSMAAQANTWSASRSSTAATRTRPRARRSTWCSRRKAWAGTWKRSASTRAPRNSRRPKSWPTGPSSKDAMRLYGKNFAITARPGMAPPLRIVPKDYEARLVKMDFSWAAENRERILDEWKKRYDSKSEKKSQSRQSSRPRATSRGWPQDLFLELRRHPQGVRRLHRPARHQPGHSTRASSSAFSGPRAAARPRCCASSPAWKSQTAGEVWQGGRDISGAAAGAARLRHRVPVVTRCSPTSVSPTTSAYGW